MLLLPHVLLMCELGYFKVVFCALVLSLKFKFVFLVLWVSPLEVQVWFSGDLGSSLKGDDSLCVTGKILVLSELEALLRNIRPHVLTSELWRFLEFLGVVIFDDL